MVLGGKKDVGNFTDLSGILRQRVVPGSVSRRAPLFAGNGKKQDDPPGFGGIVPGSGGVVFPASFQGADGCSG